MKGFGLYLLFVSREKKTQSEKARFDYEKRKGREGVL